jgi:hypothetical protein
MAATTLGIGAGSGGADQGDEEYLPGEITPAEGPVDPLKQSQEQLKLDRWDRNQKLKAKLLPNYTNLEEIFPKVVSELRNLILGYRVEGIVSRRWESMRIRQAHLFWMGIQGGYYDPADWQWHLPFGTTVGLGLGVEDGEEDYDSPEYDYVTNYYQAYGLDFQALMSAKIPTPKFYPLSAQNEQDVTTAKAADDVRKLNEKNNPPKKLAKRNAWLFWCDGKVGGYVRWVRDGARFGFEEVSDVDASAQKMGGDSFVCPQCQAENDGDDDQGNTNGQEGDEEQGGNQDGAAAAIMGLDEGRKCEKCGADLTDEDFKPADYVPVPTITGTRRVAKGQVVMSLIPGLQFHTPPWADEMPEFPYLQWNLEVHKAKLKASFPHAAKKIGSGGVTSADDVQMRAFRLQVQQGLPVTQPGDALAQLVTFSRTWIRPWSFWEIESDESRDLLMDLFPEGAYVAFAGEAFCEARTEQMEKCWRVRHAMEGDGQNRPSAGDSSVQVCEQINDISNIEQETADYTIPITIYDNELLDGDAINGAKARPGDFIPTKMRTGPNDVISNKIWQSAQTELSQTLTARRQELAGPVLQRLTGIQPASYGAQDAPGDAAAKYSMEREQALQRIGLFYAEWVNFYSELHLLGVECFRDNAANDVEMSVEEEGGGYESKYIRMADLQGHIEVYQESDDSYPELPSEVKSIALRMLENERIGPELASGPGNLRQLKDMLGMQSFAIPGDDAEIKTMRTIKRLLQSQPIQPPPQVIPGPMGPVAGPPPPPQPSEMPDPILDAEDVAVFMSEIRHWWQSEQGQEAATANPGGVANVRAYYQACKQIASQQQSGAGKPPSASINLKDLPPSGQVQLAAQDGIQLDPAELVQKQQQDRADKQQQKAVKLQSLQAGKKAGGK